MMFCDGFFNLDPTSRVSRSFQGHPKSDIFLLWFTHVDLMLNPSENPMTYHDFVT